MNNNEELFLQDEELNKLKEKYSNTQIEIKNINNLKKETTERLEQIKSEIHNRKTAIIKNNK